MSWPDKAAAPNSAKMSTRQRETLIADPLSCWTSLHPSFRTFRGCSLGWLLPRVEERFQHLDPALGLLEILALLVFGDQPFVIRQGFSRFFEPLECVRQVEVDRVFAGVSRVAL